MSTRERVVQENESEFRRPRQILTLLPYSVPRPPEHERHLIRYGEDEEYHDPDKLLKDDLRQQWWKNYGALTGKGYKGLPKDLSREDLDEITAQPLLNYLVALSFTRDKLDFTKDINLNSIYADLVAAVHERGYERHRPYGPIRHMNPGDFSRVLEEIGLAAWHGIPMEQLQLGSFKEAQFQSRNAEEALLVALNACASMTEQVSAIQYGDGFFM